MKDILLDSGGDLALSPDGDISLVESPVQAVMIKLRWYLAEWVFDPEKGIPWYESILVKKPDLDGIRKILTREILDVDSVAEVTRMDIRLDPEDRTAVIRFRFRTDAETYNGEVVMHG